jgi:TatA/E family protein of Tat protein translocase
MSFSETIFLFFLALIIFGPKKLPQIARQVGKALNEFRRASNEFKAQIEQEIANLEHESTPQTLASSPSPEGVVSSRSLNSPELVESTLAGPVEDAKVSTERAESSTESPGAESQSEQASLSQSQSENTPVAPSNEPRLNTAPLATPSPQGFHV